MTTNQTNPVAELNKILRETFKDETKGSIARAPMFGDADNCWIFTGPSAYRAATLVAARLKGKTTKSESSFKGYTSISYVVEFVS